MHFTLTDQTRSISWKFFLQFVGSKSRQIEDYTTEEVVSKVIIPETTCQKSSYTDIVSPNCSSLTPNYFVIHAHNAPFMDLVQSLKEHIQIEADDLRSDAIYLWIDIFAINLHAKTRIELENLCFITQIAKQGSLVYFDRQGSIFRRYDSSLCHFKFQCMVLV